MAASPPYAAPFQTPVHGTVFAGRAAVVQRLRVGDRLILVPDPLSDDEPPAVWVHAEGGDVVGYLPPQVAVTLAPWMLGGGRCGAFVERVGAEDVASWQRLIVRVECRS